MDDVFRLDAFRLTAGTELVIATHNAGKLKEFKDLFNGIGLSLHSAGELDLDEPEETGSSFVENARLKAHASAKASGKLSLADDSGLCVDALDGQPGIYTARWAGVPRDFCVGMQRVEDELQKVGATAPDQRTASFNATLCLAHPDGRDMLFEGKASGTLVWPPVGDLGFGFDPTFMPDGFDITFGEMPSETKHSWSRGNTGLSHRARAFAKLVEACCDI